MRNTETNAGMTILENYLSLPQTNKANNDQNILDAQEWIRTHYEDALTDGYVADDLAKEAADLSMYLDARNLLKK
jgi:hypothetical protein